MGINIGLKYMGKNPIDLSWWDSMRCSGDRAFIGWKDAGDQVRFSTLECWESNTKAELVDWIKRINNHELARKWVNDHLAKNSFPQANADRLLELIDKMEQYPDLWIDVSY